MHPNGHMNDLAGADLNGLDRFKARKVAVEKLTELGALEKEEPYTNNVGFSERADVPIEPRLSEQWFLKYPSVEKARAAWSKLRSAGCPAGERLNENARQDSRRSPIKCASIRSAGRRFTTTGWATSRTGASAASFGGDIGFRCGGTVYHKADLRRSTQDWAEALLSAENVTLFIESRTISSQPARDNGLRAKRNDKFTTSVRRKVLVARIAKEVDDSIAIETLTESDTSPDSS